MRMANIFKALSLLSLALLMVACFGGKVTSSSGGEVTGVGGRAFTEPTPYGMTLIKRGHLRMGMEKQDSLPAGRYHLEAIGFAAGKGVLVYVRNSKGILVQEEIPLDDPDGKGNMLAMTLDSLASYDYFKPLKGQPVNEDFDQNKEYWSIVRSASFDHAGGTVQLGICNQAKLLGQPANDFPARKFGLMDLRLVADSPGAVQ